MRPETLQHQLQSLPPPPSAPPSLPFTTNPLLKDSPSPPDKDHELHDQFPASFRTGDDISTSYGIPHFDLLTSELSPTRIHQRIRYLWLAGRPVPPRPLHHQLLLGRDIFVSERIDLHLVWGGGRIFVKPIPRYLLNPDFWSTHLSSQTHGNWTHLRQCAMGFC